MKKSATTAIVDTNVILDIFTVNDLVGAYAKRDDSESLFRRVRIRESLLLAWYLRSIGATTRSLQNEVTRLMVKRAPPESTTIESRYPNVMVNFVRPYVLDRWNVLLDDSDAGLVGRQCDDKLLELAKEHSAPLITNEGYSIDGVSSNDPKKLRARGAAKQLRVFTPREFWQGQMGDRAWRRFLKRFTDAAPKFIKREAHPEAMEKALGEYHSILRHVFFGKTSTGDRLPVKLPPTTSRNQL